MSADESRKHGSWDEHQDHGQEDEESVRYFKFIRRTASVYDAVAGWVGLSGFPTAEQLGSSSLNPLVSEEVLLRRADAPGGMPHHFNNANEHIPPAQTLADPDLLRAYTSGFYSAATHDRG
jgi:hypothetical protein